MRLGALHANFAPGAHDAVAQRILAWLDALGDPLTLYRELVVNDEAAIDYERLGHFWSASAQAAVSPYGRADRSQGQRFLVTVNARRRDVDEAETIATMRRYPDELEVRLREGAPVDIVDVRGRDDAVQQHARRGSA